MGRHKKEEEPILPHSPPPIYDDLSVEEETREVEMPEEDGARPPTLTEQIQAGSDLSETKVAMKLSLIHI